MLGICGRTIVGTKDGKFIIKYRGLAGLISWFEDSIGHGWRKKK